MAARRRRANGEGCAPRQLPSGAWQWRITLGFTQGKQVTKSGTAPTRSAAARAMAQAIAARDQGLLPLPNAVTVEQWVRRWLRGVRVQLALSTQNNYQHLAEKHLFPVLGEVPVQALRPAQVREAYARLAEGGYSASVLRQVRAVLSGALRDAVLEELVPRNVAEHVPLPPCKAPAAGRALSAPETRAFLAQASSHPLGVLFEVAVATGLRRGELCALRWTFVDLETGTLQVRENLPVVGGRAAPGRPKTGASVRDVPLAPETWALLQAHRDAQAAGRAALGLPPCPDGFVFCGARGERLHPQQVTRLTRQLAAAAGLGRVRLHDLRHTHTDLQLQRGVPVEVVSRQLGHARVDVTLNRYRHVQAREARRYALGLSELLCAGAP